MIDRKRLQLGTSRLERLGSVNSVFLDPSWVHLGDPEPKPQVNCLESALSMWQEYGLRHLLRGVSAKVRSPPKGHHANASLPIEGDPYLLTNFQAWYYAKGDSLPFEDAIFGFVFSEHFFEHLFFDEAIALLRECWRILDSGGVIRTAVPDADLRVDLPPEPIGFPNKSLRWTHPAKHKTRWSVYMLDEALKSTGFDPVWIRYCDRDGMLNSCSPAKMGVYGGCSDLEMIQSLGYLRREGSLIVDGIKR